MLRVGILINTIYADYSTAFLKGAECYCADHDCLCYVFPLAHGMDAGFYDYHYDTLLQFISKNNIDAFVIATATFGYDSRLAKLLDLLKKIPSMPKISLGLKIQGIPTIKVDCDFALKNLCSHLMEEHGVKNPLVLRCSKNNLESDEREKILLKAFAARKIKIPKEKILDAAFRAEIAYSILSAYIEKNGVDFDAVICLNDAMAMGAYKSLAERNLKIPKDIILTGFDNIFETHSEQMSITSVDQRIEDLAILALQELAKIVAGQKPQKLKTVSAVPIFRSSCGCKEKLIFQKAENKNLFLQKSYDALTRNENQIYMLHHFMMETQTPVSLDDLYSRLHYSLCLFDISAFAIVLYYKPIFYEKNHAFKRPSSAKVAMTFFNGEFYERPDTIFNPNKNLLPPPLVKKMQGEFTVFPLFAERVQYGYLFFQFGHYEKIFYQTVFELIAKEIVTSIEISLEQRENSSLKHQNISLEEYSKKMHALSFTDEMTGLLNRRGFYEYAHKKIAQVLEDSDAGRGLVIFCDMDGLKKINDTYGHDAGDRAIKYEAKVLRKVFRQSDILARLGGDEFVVVAAGMRAQDFLRIKNALAVECQKVNSEKHEPFSLSISCGYTEFDLEHRKIDDLLMRADAAQYRDKRSKKK